MPLPTEFVEKVDKRTAHYLLSCLKQEEGYLTLHQDENDEHQQNQSYYKKLLLSFTRGGGLKKVSYKKSTLDTKSLLRWYSNGGLQSMPSAFRGALLRPMNVVDVDMCNAHPLILLNLCERYNVPHRYLEDYCENRDDLIERKEVTKVQAIKSLNKNTKMKGSAWFESYDTEIKLIQKAMIPHFPDLWEMAQKKKHNQEGRFIAYVCQYWENKILEHCVANFPFPVMTLMFDGFMFEGTASEGLLDVLSEMCSKEFDMNLHWAFKHHDRSIVIPDDFEYEECFHAEDDAVASEYILEQVEGRLFQYNGLIFYKEENEWIIDPSEIERKMCAFIMKANIRKPDGKPYSSNVNGTRHIWEAVKFQIPEKDIKPLCHSTTKGKLCFRNGVLDMRTGVLTPWEDCENIETPIIIQHDYVPHSTTEIKQRMFDKMFGDDVDTALHAFSRALGGYTEDKNWISYVGSRNCGKGSLYGLFSSAFGDYVKSWNVQACMYHVKKGADVNEVSRKLYWLIPHEFTRLAISQEVPTAEMNMKINSSLFKRFAGGEDKQIAKENYSIKDQHFIMDTTWCIFGNNSVVSDASDIYDHCVDISTAFEYLGTQAEIDAMPLNVRHKYILGDPHIKEWVKTPDAINACITLMVESFRETKVAIIHDRETSDDLKLIDELMLRYNVNLQDGRFVLLGTDVFKEFPDKKKVKAELASMGVEYKVMRTTTHPFYNKRCFFGLADKMDAVDNI